jgi:hypothetical protein
MVFDKANASIYRPGPDYKAASAAEGGAGGGERAAALPGV